MAGALYGASLVATVHTLRARRDTVVAPPESMPESMPESTLARSLGALLSNARSHPPRVRAFLVARSADCSGNFDFLDLFDRPPVRSRLDLAGVVALGDEDAVPALRAALAAHGRQLPVWSASPAARLALASLGVRSTPYLVVVDGDGALRFAAGAPATVRQYLALGATLPLIGDITTTPARD